MSILSKYIINKNNIKCLFYKADIRPFLIALLIFVCSTGVVVSHYYFICWVFILLYYRKPIPSGRSYDIMKIIIALSIINEIIGLFFNEHLVLNSVLEIIPYSAMILLTMYTATIVDDKILRWLVVFTIVDILTAIVQRTVGVNSFFPATVTDLGDTLFYDMSVNGWHLNSAGLGESVFLGLLIFESHKKCRVIKGPLFYTLVCIGAFLCFNRTTMVSIVAYFVFKAIKENKKYLLILFGSALAIFVFSNKEIMDILFMQFFRGADSLASGNAVSERDVVYPFYWNFAKDNFLFGNNSFKYYVEVFKDGRQFHAHNSYLQTLANNGFIISGLYFYMILRGINKDNYHLILPILLFACFQSFILWGLSYGDLIFYNILLTNRNENTNNEGTFKINSIFI